MMHPIKLTRNAIRGFLQSDKPGVVLLISSDAGLYPFTYCPLYVATKHAIVGFVWSMDWLDAEQGVKIFPFVQGKIKVPKSISIKD
jgi:short-subunit dehydrogenase